MLRNTRQTTCEIRANDFALDGSPRVRQTWSPSHDGPDRRGGNSSDRGVFRMTKGGASISRHSAENRSHSRTVVHTPRVPDPGAAHSQQRGWRPAPFRAIGGTEPVIP